MNARQAWDLAKQAVSSWSEDRAPSMGAALSYYTVFSVAPLLLIAISVAGLVFGVDAARGAVVEQLQGVLGEQAAQAIQSVLQSVAKPAHGMIATAIGALLLLVGATTVLAELQSDLDLIWKAPARSRPSGVWGLLRSRVLSVGMIMGIGFLLLVSLVLSAAIAALGDWWGPMFGGWEALAQAVNFVVSYGLVTALFALIYRFMPAVKIEWHDVWVGAAVTALLFTIGKFAIGLYIGKSSVASGFGAAGSLAVLLVWVYYSAQIFLLGAEFTQAYAHAYGSRKALQGRAAGALGGTPGGQAGAGASAASPTSAPLSQTLYPASAPKRTAPQAPREGRVAAALSAHLLPAIGLAAALGALSAWALRRRVRRPLRRAAPNAASPRAAGARASSSAAPFAAKPLPSAGPFDAMGHARHAAMALAKSVAAGAAMAALNSLTGAARRGFKRGLPAAARRARMRAAG